MGTMLAILGSCVTKGKRWPVTAAAHGGADRRARWNPLSFRALLLHLSEPLCKPEVQFPWSSFLLCINPKQPSPSHIQAPAPFQLHQPCWLERRETPSMLLLCVYVDITSRLFGCVCQSVLTERNTGIYPAITTVSGQALCRNWVGDVSVSLSGSAHTCYDSGFGNCFLYSVFFSFVFC